MFELICNSASILLIFGLIKALCVKVPLQIHSSLSCIMIDLPGAFGQICSSLRAKICCPLRTSKAGAQQSGGVGGGGGVGCLA